jgi:uncharacterized repeat protein (TIGR03803 family)
MSQTFYTGTMPANQYGTISKFVVTTNSLTREITFSGLESLTGSMILASNGKFYGMTHVGYANGGGTIFSFDPHTGAHETLHRLYHLSTGSPFFNGFVTGNDGKLYSAIQNGGTNNLGHIISFDPSNNSVTVRAAFDFSKGYFPVGTMVRGANGMFYGATRSGGSNGYGMIYSFNPSTNAISVLHNINGIFGTSPFNSLILASNGKLYGMLEHGVDKGGSIFSFDLATNTYTHLHAMNSISGFSPRYNNFIETGGKLYSSVSKGGANNYGTIISVDLFTGSVVKLHDFDLIGGSYPLGLTLSSNGKIYGLTERGGTADYGTIFTFDPLTNTHIKLQDFNGTNGAYPRWSALVELPSTYFKDADGDGYGDAAIMLSDTSKITGFVKNNTDCNDKNAMIFPGAKEECNGIDDNCDGVIDEGLSATTFYKDADGDGFGTAKDSVKACASPLGYVSNKVDCDDTKASINPAAPEVCNGIDDNCDGRIDEGVMTIFYRDYDGDGFGNNIPCPAPCEGNGLSILACTAPPGYVSNNKDCNDGDKNIYPGAPEACNGIDDNCNGLIDEEVTFNWLYRDNDGDGYGNSKDSIWSCTRNYGYVINSTDCDDRNAKVYPGAPEVCNGIDDNCDGLIDEGFQISVFYNDADGDGFGSAEYSIQSCSRPWGFVSNNTDCNDWNRNVYPGATEVCNGIDDDCDGLIDEGLKFTFFRDADGDGFGNVRDSVQACSLPVGYSSNSKDCYDADAAVYPGATEMCDGKDNNCNGQVDEGFKLNTYYFDADGDGFYAGKSISIKACSQPKGYASKAGDCNDNNRSVFPGAIEICDGLDNDCNGKVDDKCTTIPAPGIIIDDITVYESEGVAYVAVRLSQPPTQQVSIQFNTEDGSASHMRDYIETRGELVFYPGVTLANITIPVVRDNTSEPNELFVLRLSKPKNGNLLNEFAIITIKEGAVAPFITAVNPVSIDAKVDVSKIRMSIYPNPATKQFTLRLKNSNSKKAEIIITDALGAVAFKKSIVLQEAEQQINIDLGRKASGIYFLKVISEDGIQTLKVLMQR